MNTKEAAELAITTISDAKKSIIDNGYADAEIIYATCNKLSKLLNMNIEDIVAIFEKVQP